LVEWFEVLEGGGEEFRFGACEISGGFGSQHFERIDDRFGGAEVDGFLAGLRVGDLAEEESGVLGLEDDEFVESGIRCGAVWHGLERSGENQGRKAERMSSLH